MNEQDRKTLSDIMKVVGSIKTPKKAASSRLNGLLGGRKPLCVHRYVSGERHGLVCKNCGAYRRRRKK